MISTVMLLCPIKIGDTGVIIFMLRICNVVAFTFFMHGCCIKRPILD